MVTKQTDLEKVLAAEIMREEYRVNYNKRPNVIAARRLYNAFRQEQAKIARLHLKGALTKEQAMELMSKLTAPAKVSENGTVTPAKPAVERKGGTSNR